MLPDNVEGKREFTRIRALPLVGANDFAVCGEFFSTLFVLSASPVATALISPQCDQGVTEPIELDLGFALGGLDHERAATGQLIVGA